MSKRSRSDAQLDSNLDEYEVRNTKIVRRNDRHIQPAISSFGQESYLITNDGVLRVWSGYNHDDVINRHDEIVDLSGVVACAPGWAHVLILCSTR